MKRTIVFGLAFASSVVGFSTAVRAESTGERILSVLERQAKDIDANKPDCDKIGAALLTHADDDAATLKAAKAADKGKSKSELQAEQKSFETRYSARIKAAMVKMAPLRQCRTNAKVKEYRAKTDF